MLEGKFQHQDSTGSKGIMESGDVQWMKTGRGIIHSEMPAMSGGRLLGFQLWINMPLKKNKPKYLYIKKKELGFYKDEDMQVKVIAGKFKDVEGPEKNHNVDPTYFHVVLKPGLNVVYRKIIILLFIYNLKIGKNKHSNTHNSNLILLNRSLN